MITRTDAAIHAALDSPVLPQGTQVIRREGWYQIITPGLKEASSNEVMLSHLADSEIEDRVAETFSLYRQHGLPFKWAIGPMSSPARLEQVISKSAETSWNFQGMAIDSDASLPPSPEVTTEIVSAENFEDFMSVNLQGWELQEFADQTRAKLETMLRHPQFRLFLTRRKGQPIGTAATILKKEYGYLSGAVVLKEHRGCGAYRALVQERLLDLRKLNLSFAVTQAREATSAPILLKLGFDKIFDAKIYRFSGDIDSK